MQEQGFRLFNFLIPPLLNFSPLPVFASQGTAEQRVMPGRGTATGLSHVLVGLCRGGILWDTPVHGGILWDTPVPWWDPLG